MTKGRTTFQDPNKSDKAGRTKLFSFTSSGDFEKVKQLVERGANVSHRDHAGWTPLHVAALKGQYAIAEYLIQHGALPNARGFENDTPLHDACSSGHPQCVKLLIRHGANVYALNADKKKPIDVVVQNDDVVDILKAKMTELDKLALKDDQGRTRLHRACIQPTVELEELLDHLKTGMDVNALDIHQKTPLQYAIERGELDFARALIDHGANAVDATTHGTTFLHIACQHGHQAIVQLLIDTGADVHALDSDQKTPYQVTTSIAIRQMITARMDEEHKERVIAAAIDEVTFVSNSKERASISTAASLNLLVSSTTTALNNKAERQLSREERKIQAIMKSFENVEKKKRRKSVDTAEKSKRNRSLSCHSRESSTSMDEKRGSFKKDTDLHTWCIRGDVMAVQELLQAGADPNTKDSRGHSPLHCATGSGFIGIVQLLLDHGADMDCRDSEGLTALDIATTENHTAIMRLLKNHKASNSKKKQHKNIITGSRVRSESATLPIRHHEKVRVRQLSSSSRQHPPNFDDLVPEERSESPLYPTSRYLPLYTIPYEVMNQANTMKNEIYVLDLQISLLLGLSIHEFASRYPLLHRKPVLMEQKEQLWPSPLSSMICSEEKQKFLDMELHFVSLDHVTPIIKENDSQLSKRLITMPLEKQQQNIKMPPKFAMKMKKCGLLK